MMFLQRIPRTDTLPIFEMELAPGVVLIRNFLTPDDQRLFCAEVQSFYGARGPKQHGDVKKLLSKKQHQGRYLLGFETSAEFIPDAFQRWGAAAMTCGARVCKELAMTASPPPRG